jgi:hypothetical protein
VVCRSVDVSSANQTNTAIRSKPEPTCPETRYIVHNPDLFEAAQGTQLTNRRSRAGGIVHSGEVSN